MISQQELAVDHHFFYCFFLSAALASDDQFSNVSASSIYKLTLKSVAS